MNKVDSTKQEALRWLRFSGEDISAAFYLANKADAPRHVCWHCRQAAEKALKAALVLEEIDFPSTHDLNTLQNLLPEVWTTQNAYSDLAKLTE